MGGKSAARAAMGKRDANHAEIVRTYELLHCGVIDTHGVGFGYPDIEVHFSGYCCPVEIKTEDGELSESQKRFIRDWKGPKIEIVRNADDVIAHVTRERARRVRGTREGWVVVDEATGNNIRNDLINAIYAVEPATTPIPLSRKMALSGELDSEPKKTRRKRARKARGT